jgi:hypothetical protein
MLFLNGYTIMALSQKESLFMSVLIVDWASLMPMEVQYNPVCSVGG